MRVLTVNRAAIGSQVLKFQNQIVVLGFHISSATSQDASIDFDSAGNNALNPGPPVAVDNRFKIRAGITQYIPCEITCQTLTLTTSAVGACDFNIFYKFIDEV